MLVIQWEARVPCCGCMAENAEMRRSRFATELPRFILWILPDMP